MTAKVLCKLRRLSQERVMEYSGFQVTGMIEWRQKSIKTRKKFLEQNLTPNKFHAELPSHKNSNEKNITVE